MQLQYYRLLLQEVTLHNKLLLIRFQKIEHPLFDDTERLLKWCIAEENSYLNDGPERKNRHQL